MDFSPETLDSRKKWYNIFSSGEMNKLSTTDCISGKLPFMDEWDIIKMWVHQTKEPQKTWSINGKSLK